MFSVVIPTYKRDEDLEECLKSIRMNSFDKNIEIIVLHSGIKTTEQICKKYNAISILDNARKNGKRIKSLWAIINDGILLAKNDNVMYLNDDCVVLPDWDKIAQKYFSDSMTGILILKTKGIGQDPNFRIVYNGNGIPCANYGIINKKAKILFDQKYDWFYGDADITCKFSANSNYSIKCTAENMIIHNHTIDENRKINESNLKKVLKDELYYKKKWKNYILKKGKLKRLNYLHIFYRNIKHIGKRICLAFIQK